MSFDPKAIANYFLSLGDAEGKPITPLQMVKLVYIAHGWHLGLSGTPLVNEGAEAWQYGPVLPSIYHEFKNFGNAPITCRAVNLVPNSPTFFEEPSIPSDPAFESLRNFLRQIWRIYGKRTGIELSSLTHEEGTPWYITWFENGGKDSRSVPIPDDLIKQHYQELRKKNVEQSS